MRAFMRAAGTRHRREFADYDALYQWSIEQPEHFWREVWSFCDVIGEGPGNVTVEHRERMPGARWFPQARLNFAENLLRRRDHAPALVFWGEDRIKSSVSFAELHQEVSRLAQALRNSGVRAGDVIVRVAEAEVSTPAQVAARIREAERAKKEAVPLLVMRDGTTYYLALEFANG